MNKWIVSMHKLVLGSLILILCLVFYQTTWAQAVGATAADDEVDRFGAFNYRIPIYASSGAGGIQSAIALVYNSQSHFGIAGQGWELDGLSTIHRCQQIPLLHKTRKPITFSDDDVLCLDGSYLHNVRDNEYRKVINGFEKIYKFGDGMQTVFEVHSKDGRIARYGGAANAWSGKAGKEQKILSWLVQSIHDRHGNQLQFSYTGSADERHIQRIDYGQQIILFEYETRAVKFTHYMAGVALAMTQRLKKIVSYVGEDLVREYRLGYITDDVNPDRLDSVTECVEHNQCLRPTQLGWNSSNEFGFDYLDNNLEQRFGNQLDYYHVADFNGDGFSDVYAIGAFNSQDDVVYIGNKEGGFRELNGTHLELEAESDISNLYFADFNGDGLTDIYHFRYRHEYDLIYLARWHASELSFEPIDGIPSGVSAKPDMRGQCIQINCLKFGDFDGDGRLDVYRIRHDARMATTDDIYLFDGNGLYRHIAGIDSYADQQGQHLSKAETYRLHVADFNGDMRADIYYINKEAQQADDIYLSLGAGEYQRIDGIHSQINFAKDMETELSRIRLADFNADGLTDIYYVPPKNNANNAHNAHTKNMDGNFRQCPPVMQNKALKYLAESFDWLLSSVHARSYRSNWSNCQQENKDEIYLSIGDGRYRYMEGLNRKETDNLLTSLNRLHFADFNADGLTDIYYIGEPQEEDTIWLASYAGGFHLQQSIQLGVNQHILEYSSRLNFADFNGDGVLDIVYIHHEAEQGIHLYLNQSQPMLMDEIINGLGLRTNIVYQPAVHVTTQSINSLQDNYDDSYPENYSASSLSGLWVVTDISRENSVMEHFSYADTRSHLNGLGFLGFTTIAKKNYGRNLVEHTEYQLSFPYLGVVSKQISKIDNATQAAVENILSQKTTQYGALALHDNEVLIAYPIQTVEQRYEVDGSLLTNLLTEYSTPDDYGNIERIHTVVDDGKEHFRSEMHYQFDTNDDRRWAGLILRQTTINSNDNGNIKQMIEFEYHPYSYQVTREVVNSGHPLSYTREYKYDGLGNKIYEKIFATSNSNINRIREWEYDKHGLYITHLINPEYHHTFRINDLRYAKPILLIDVNGLQTKHRYDGWGRLIEEILPDGNRKTIKYSYDLPDDAPENGVYKIETQNEGYPTHTDYYDKWDRKISEEKVGFDGRIVVQDYQYDNLTADVIGATAPYYKGENEEKLVHTNKVYDALGRMIQEETPLPGRDVVFDVTYNKNTEKRANTLGQEQLLHRNGMGRVVDIEDPLNAHLTFEYDALGRLLQITDASGSVTTNAYDLFGNRTQVLDINSGLRRYEYDIFGNRIVEIDADGNESKFTYDDLNRLTLREDKDGIAEFQYDTAENGIGKLHKESFNGHSRRFKYDEKSRLSAIYDQRDYVTHNDYDEYGRLVRVDYPGNFSLRREYNDYGYLLALKGSVLDTPLPQARAADKFEKIQEYSLHAEFYRHLLTMSANKNLLPLAVVANELELGINQLQQIDDSDVLSVTEFDCTQIADAKLSQAGHWLEQIALTESANQHLHVMFARQFMQEAEFYLDCAESGYIPVQNPTRKEIELWRVSARDAAGSVLDEIRGNGWRTQREYNVAHHPIMIKTSSKTGEMKRHLYYYYDELGNIVDRHDYVNDTDEYFNYDELNRLVSATLVHSDAGNDMKETAYTYDVNGNLMSKSGVGEYTYKAQGQSYAVERAGDNHYQYDSMGNMVSGENFSVQWHVSKKPKKISIDGDWIEYQYDANHMRVAAQSSVGEEIYYAGDLLEEKVNHDVKELCNKIYVERILIAIYCEKNNHGTIHYLHHDVLGSIDTVSDEEGDIYAQFDYYPFGTLRSAVGSLPLQKGFTGHEHIQLAENTSADTVKLIHMKGRIYNAKLGRFLSPDPHIPAPLASQSYNNYSYVMNNPLRYNDPSGFFFKKIIRKVVNVFKRTVRYVKRNPRVIFAMVVGYYAGPWAADAFVKSVSANLVWSPAAMTEGAYIAANAGIVSNVVSGGVTGVLAGGSVRDGISGALSGGLSHIAGLHYQGAWTPKRILVSSTINGVTSAIGGGSFKNAVLMGLKGGSLRYAAIMMRQKMIAQSMLNSDNASGLSVGFMGDNFKLGGARYGADGTRNSILGGIQGGQGNLLGMHYNAGDWQDYLVEAYAGPHDFFNSGYWYNQMGNIKNNLSPMQKWIGESLNMANVILVTPLAVASMTPEYFYSLPH